MASNTNFPPTNPPPTIPYDGSSYENPLYQHSYESINSSPSGATDGTTFEQTLRTVADRYLTCEFIKEKTTNALRAKISPLSAPPDFKNQHKEKQQDLVISKKIMKDRKKTLKSIDIMLAKIEKQLEHLNSLLASNPLKSQLINSQQKLIADKKQFEIDRISISKQFEKSKENFLSNKAKVNYLNLKKQAQIGGRFTGYVGKVANVAVPGSGAIISTALTAASTLKQEQLANELPEVHLSDKAMKLQEQKNARYNTLITTASTLASIFFSIYAWPTIKETAWYLLNQKST